MTRRALSAATSAAVVSLLLVAGCTPIDERVQPRTIVSAPAPAPTPAPIERLQRSVDELALRMEEFARAQQASTRQSSEDMRASLASMQADLQAQDEELRHLNENFETLLSRFTSLESEVKRSEAVAVAPVRTPVVIAVPERELTPVSAAPAAAAPPPVPIRPAPVKPAPIPAAGAEETYRLGLDLYETGKHGEAISTFSDFLVRFPKDPLVPNAIYWIGESQYATGVYEAAIISFDQVIKEHPASTKVPAALLKQAMAFRELGNKIQAKMILQNLVKRFPTSPEANLAKQRLESL